jgi:hypothetical protein
MKGTQISNPRRQGKHSGLRTDETQHGCSRDGCNGTRHSAIEHFCMESEAYKIFEGWATGEDDAAFPTIAAKNPFHPTHTYHIHLHALTKSIDIDFIFIDNVIKIH